MIDKKWDPRAKPPAEKKVDKASPTYASDLEESVSGYMEWLNADMAAFQREHPDAPQGDVSRMPKRKWGQLLKLWNRAREGAELEDA
jgi:hypothetical protein